MGLPDPAFADDPHERTRLAPSPFEQLDEHGEVVLSADHHLGLGSGAPHRPNPAITGTEDRSLRDVLAESAADTERMLRLQLQLRLKQDDPPTGELTSDDGTTVAFSGRLELLAALERFTADENHDASPAADPTAESTTEAS
jgi:hypothetical protein